MERIRVSCPASCGELFQCVAEGRELLLSYGIDRRSFASLQTGKEGQSLSAQGGKVRQALGLLPPLSGLHLQQASEIPVGKGYSSSTADMVSSLQAVALCHGQALSAAELTRLCARIEPTDSVAFSSWTVIDPLSGAVVWQTDWQPRLYVYILEPIETVATLDLERMTASASYPAADSSQLLSLFEQACRDQDLSKLGQVATYSALLNNERLAKPYLQEILALARSYSCLGVNIAHSGTLVGLLLREQDLPGLPMMEQEISQSCFAAYYQKRRLCRLIYEGVRQWEVTD